MNLLREVRGLYYREGLTLSEIERRTGLTHKTIRKWLKALEGVEPKYRRNSRAAPQAPTPKPVQRPTREDFRVGDRVSFEGRHLQTRIGSIVRINQKTASVDCENEAGWRVSFGLLRHVVDL